MKTWTARECYRVMTLWNEGAHINEIAADLGVSRPQAEGQVSRLRARGRLIPRSRVATWTRSMDDKLIEGWKRGDSTADIAADLGMSISAIEGRCAQLRKRKKIERRGHKAVWTKDMDDKLCELRGKLPTREIAFLLGVETRQIHNRANKLCLPNAGKKKNERPRCGTVKFSKILRAVLDEYQVNPKFLIERSKFREHLEPRQVLMALGYELCGLSVPQIGQRLDRDHSTVLAAARSAPRKYGERMQRVRARLIPEAAE